MIFEEQRVCAWAEEERKQACNEVGGQGRCRTEFKRADSADQNVPTSMTEGQLMEPSAEDAQTRLGGFRISLGTKLLLANLLDEV